MLLSQIVAQANNIADEQEDIEKVTGFINDAIARINVRLKANFPYMVHTAPTEEPVFPEKWQRTLLVPFAVGRIKQMDSSQFEYTDAYNEFTMNLEDMAADYVVPEAYKDLDYLAKQELTSDIFVNPPLPWRW